MLNDIKNELSTNFIEYAVAVNTDRSIPDAKSGLKPVAKRILYSCYEKGRTSNKPFVKCARVVGDVMGEYHPHGDSSIYEALVRLSRPWIMRYPLIDFHGNNGNISGDGPAAARYTESRLAAISEDGLLKGIKKKNVGFIPNYDETTEEPVTLPAIFPNLLCNPNKGIGVAMACNWAPHNLREVAAAIYDYMDGKEPSIPAPDFPTGGVIINKDEAPDIIKAGRGSIKLRGKYKIEDNKIIFYEIPYGETVEGLLAEIGTACDEKEIDGITDAHDETNKKGVRIVITVEKGLNPEIIVQKLFAKTNLQSSFAYNQVALIDKTPTELTLKDCIEIYINHNIDCLIKESKFDLNEAIARKEVVEGLLKALASIDEIIALIKKYDFTEHQAKAILAMRLSSLTKIDGVKLNKENSDLASTIERLNVLIASRDEQLKTIRARLEALVKKYGDERKTELAQIEVVKEKAEKEKKEIIPEDVVVIMSQNGDIKRVSKINFKAQHRNTKGVKTLDKAIKFLVSTNTVDDLLIFTSKGKMYKLNVNNIPESTNSSVGTNITSLLKMSAEESVAAVTNLHNVKEGEYVVFFSKNGLVKKTSMDEFTSVKKSTGIQAIKIKEGDEIAQVSFVNDEDLVLITKNGMSIRFSSDEVRPMGKVASGVKSINLKDNDYVIAGLVIGNDTTDDIALFTYNGLGKRVKVNEFERQGRGGRGVSAYKLDPSDYIAAAALVNKDKNILISGQPNSVTIGVNEIPQQSRSAIGVQIINNSKIKAVASL